MFSFSGMGGLVNTGIILVVLALDFVGGMTYRVLDYKCFSSFYLVSPAEMPGCTRKSKSGSSGLYDHMAKPLIPG